MKQRTEWPSRQPVTVALWSLPQCPLLPILTLPTMQQGALRAEAALHTGDSLAVPPGFRTMVMAGGGTRGATGLIHLAPFTLQS